MFRQSNNVVVRAVVDCDSLCELSANGGGSPEDATLKAHLAELRARYEMIAGGVGRRLMLFLLTRAVGR